MNVKEIIQDYLRKNGYDGLCCPEDPCGCSIDDLMPCEESCILIVCKPAYKHPCKGEACTNKCDGYDPDDPEQECFSLKKPESDPKKPEDKDHGNTNNHS